MLAFSTDRYRSDERLDAFTEEFARRIMLLDNVWQRDEKTYHGEIDVRLIGPLACSQLKSTSVGFERNRRLDEDDTVLLSIQTKGRFQLELGGMSWDSREDFASLTTDTDPVRGRFDGEALIVRIPEILLSAYLPSGRAKDPTRIRGDSSLAQLMGTYLGAYLSLPPGGNPEVGETVARHIVDLVALAFGANGDAKEAIQAGGLRAARRQAVLDEIKKSYLIPGLTSEAVANAVGISERYLRQLLEEVGTTFTDLVLERRLDGARQMLINPALGHRRITDIAYDAGFSDLSYFNRAFRRRYSATSRDVRAAALGL